MTTLSGLGERIKAERERLGFTLEEFSVLGSCDTRDQLAYETGTEDPPADYLSSIIKFGANIEYILHGKNLDSYLTMEEQMFLAKFKQLSDDDKKQLLELLQSAQT